jgi:hypothetical protein
MTKTEVFFEVTKEQEDQAILVPPTQVTFTKEDGGTTRYVGGFFISQDRDTIVEVNVYSPQFIFLKAHRKGSGVRSVKEATIEEAKHRLEEMLT